MQIKVMEKDQAVAVCQMIEVCFLEFVAPDYSLEGVQEFFVYANAKSLQERSEDNHFVLVTADHNRIAAALEMRKPNHISLLFVDKSYQQEGIAKKLLVRAVEICKAETPSITEITVNASPYALRIYEKMGFTVVAPQNTINGISFIKMKLLL
ncbi:MAG: GNAT family N-acetyltransferase [Firmicutes bacterium]|nr:GNAT family N-acetyltransferase [Bacillota bacterium]